MAQHKAGLGTECTDMDDLFRKLGVSTKKRAPKVARCPRSHIPKAETAKTLRDADAGKNLVHYSSLDAMFEDLAIPASGAVDSNGER